MGSPDDPPRAAVCVNRSWLAMVRALDALASRGPGMTNQVFAFGGDVATPADEFLEELVQEVRERIASIAVNTARKAGRSVVKRCGLEFVRLDTLS